MTGILEQYAKKDGSEAVRIRFPSWPLPSGKVVHNVSIFPHECSTDVCEEGDHVHVDIYDSRPASKVVRTGIRFSTEQEEIVSQMLQHQLMLNMHTHEIAQHLEGAFAV